MQSRGNQKLDGKGQLVSVALQKDKGHEKHAEHRHASSYTRLPLYIKSSILTSQVMNSGLRALHCRRTANSLNSSFLQQGG